MFIKTRKVEGLFEEAFVAFVNEEADGLIMGVHEQNSCGRLAIYLDRALQRSSIKGYYVDTEYNRKQDAKVKTIIDDHQKVIKIRCDLILHSRGEIPGQDNLLAVEMKKSDRPREERDSDHERLVLMTRRSYDGIWSTGDGTLPEHVCGYGLGVFIGVDRLARTIELKYYKDGAMTEARKLNF